MRSSFLEKPLSENSERKLTVREESVQSLPPKRQVATGWRRIAYLTVAGGFFVLGGAGAILPGLPATPFLLLTSYFLIRSSPRLNQKLLESRVFGPILVDWQVHGGVRPHVKLKAVAVVMLTVTFTIYLSGYSIFFASVVLALATVGITVIWRLPVTRSSALKKS